MAPFQTVAGRKVADPIPIKILPIKNDGAIVALGRAAWSQGARSRAAGPFSRARGQFMRLICALLLTVILAATAGTASFAADHPTPVALVIGTPTTPTMIRS
jgi:hypothetical protein